MVCVFTATSCEIKIPQIQSTHECLNTAFGSVTKLQHLQSNEPHDIVAEIQNWATDRPADAPFVQAYSITYDYTLGKTDTITLGQNVYVSICTYSADLNFKESQIVLSTDENGVVNSGFEIYDCPFNSCFAAMEPAVKVTKNYL